MIGQNPHLNLFRHYAASEDQQVLENNLTRALALCLQHDALFLYALLGSIVGEAELRGHLHLTYAEDRLRVDVQQRVQDLGACATLYAVALTGVELDAATYPEVAAWRNDTPVTDLTIRYKDVLVLVEVKRTNENCLGQLKGQVEAYLESQSGEQPAAVKPVALSWAKVVRLATNIQNLRQLTGQASPYTTDLVQFVQYHFPHWDEVLPFRFIPFAHSDGINAPALYKRLHYIQGKAFGDRLKSFNDRVAMPLDETWASEVITYPELHDGTPCISVNVWPGNTKQQGWSVYGRPLDWTQRTTLQVQGQEYPVAIQQYIKFSHFNRYIFEILLEGELEPYARNFQSWAAFDTYSGQRWRAQWPELESWLDRDTDGKWRAHLPAWTENFVDTDRNYAAVALGFQITLLLPYAELQRLDTSTERWEPVACFLQSATAALQALVNGTDYR
ncbi:hypothetical protein [Hymenobacter crusticola]|uniref:PD-(D/E)XK nuclease superfamily protein n=1 Tax=Hymenobacter crusticola TaxID=1770526 RepID=A0A243W6G0_9BACT|nr:hypothetical protein [Hymenobacter crusticola]OUJ69934.1 hypothetical protein BXP70_25675 [Hymenobacter crusticola]